MFAPLKSDGLGGKVIVNVASRYLSNLRGTAFELYVSISTYDESCIQFEHRRHKGRFGEAAKTGRTVAH
ncbi:hypothetical protein AGR4A_pAt10467 [Agrobacterium tumefaciens str. B6]|uniref:Uncharacterized protein n=1 Tax=Agrobacterium tumefaciens str. B6 TaxID=1183423 RepID=A0A822V6G8_AGRTU|nr:hypothetical protein AGR4A_pAt10467 [Agrobacterium tumefaciens str. B6]